MPMPRPTTKPVPVVAVLCALASCTPFRERPLDAAITDRPEPADLVKADAPVADVTDASDVVDVPSAPDVVDVTDAADARDASDVTDAPAPLDAPDVADVPMTSAPTPPRPVAPLSVSLTSDRPLLRWSLAAMSDGARVQLCRERACATVVHDLTATGAEIRPPTLARGAWFWRLQGRAGARNGDAWSPTWEFVVRPRLATPPPPPPDGGPPMPGSSVYGTIPDFNGDGLADVAIGSTGAVHVYPGVTSGLTPTLATTLTSPETGGTFGCNVASMGDVNGDGFADLAVSAGNVVHVYAGSAAGLGSRPLRAFRPTAGDIFRGSCAMTSTGDLDGDGYADLAILGSTTSSGRANVQVATSRELGTTGFEPRRVSAVYDHLLGHGDFNGDGVADLVSYDATQTLTMPPPYAFLYVDPGATGTFTTSNRPLRAMFPAPRAYGRGAAIDDVNGDGFTDVVGFMTGTDSALQIHPGGPAGVSQQAMMAVPVSPISGLFSGGDLNGDGAGDIVIPDTPQVRMGPGFQDNRFYFSATPSGSVFAAVGDLNGDGLDDLVVSTPSSRSVRIFLGRMRWMSLDNAPSFTLTNPPTAPANFGAAVARAF